MLAQVLDLFKFFSFMELDLAPPMLTCILGQSFGIRIAIRWVWVWGTFLTVFAVCFLVAERACAVEGGRYAASAEKEKKLLSQITISHACS